MSLRKAAQSVLPRGLDVGAEQFLAALVRTSNDAIIGKTIEGRVNFWNHAAQLLYGYTTEEMMGRDISILFPADRTKELSELLTRVCRGETIRDYHTMRVRKNGSYVAVSITMSPVVDDIGCVLGISVIAHDLTQFNLQIADLREAHRRANETLSMLETLHGSAPVGLGFIDLEGRAMHLNEMLASVNGSTVDEQIGKKVADIVPEIWQQIGPVFNFVVERDEAVLNIEVAGEIAAQPGHQRHWLASYYPVHLDSEVIGVGVVVIDVTERRLAEEFRSSVMNNMAEGLISVDAAGRLTSMNSAAAQMLGWNEDDLMGQVMSDVILPRGANGELMPVPSELLKVRSARVTLHLDDTEYVRKDGSRLAVALTASPLISGDTVDGAVVVFRDITDERDERLRTQRELDGLAWIGRIREALDEDRFVLFAQPIVPLRGGRASEELLIRMVARDGTVVGPVEFLGIAEKFGLINEIDRWVVGRACALAARGRHVGVNLSAESIESKDMLAFIKGTIDSTRADPHNLVFEITETALMVDIEKGRAFTRGIVELGSSIALDDFGTGFGTFTHVKNLKVKYLKIDIEFVRGLVESVENQHVVKAIVDLARGFGCETVAEGVEDGDVLELLRDYGVDYVQGFHLGRPAPLIVSSMARRSADVLADLQHSRT
jgi:PAS domain S-box-containing protein